MRQFLERACLFACGRTSSCYNFSDPPANSLTFNKPDKLFESARLDCNNICSPGLSAITRHDLTRGACGALCLVVVRVGDVHGDGCVDIFVRWHDATSS